MRICYRRTPAKTQLAKRDLNFVFYRRTILVFCAARRRKAADAHFVSGGADPQEVFEERRLVPVEELGEKVVEGSAPTAGQRKILSATRPTRLLSYVPRSPGRLGSIPRRPAMYAAASSVLSRAIPCRSQSTDRTACYRKSKSRPVAGSTPIP